jgi:hypothetical protein
LEAISGASRAACRACRQLEIVVMLSVAVVNEALEFRQSRRWTVLAQS